MPPDSQFSAWGSRFGFYVAAVASAFGLGNVWRFPYIVAENGGGAFVLIYLALVFLLGMPLLIGELVLGKTTRSPIVPAVKTLARGSRPWIATGYLVVLMAILVLSYYSVVSGWVLHFFIRFLTAAFSPGLLDSGAALDSLMRSGWLQLALASIHIIVLIFAVTRRKGLIWDKWIGRAMPLFLLLLAVLAVQSISMESAADAFRFFLYPDFSKLNAASLGRAIGQVFFTLSIGFGTMVTFGNNVGEKTSVAVAGFRVAIFDSLISIGVGLMIFPLVFSRDISEVGPQLLFETVPFLFGRLEFGIWLGIGFFFFLYFAALGAGVTLFETAVLNVRETFKWSQKKSTYATALVCLWLAIIPALSSSVLKKLNVHGMSLLEAWDGILINWLLPVAAILVSQLVLRRVEEESLRTEFDAAPMAAMGGLYGHWRFAVRFVVPLLCILGLGLQIYGLVVR